MKQLFDQLHILNEVDLMIMVDYHESLNVPRHCLTLTSIGINELMLDEEQITINALYVDVHWLNKLNQSISLPDRCAIMISWLI
jgi:hypothetical protein